MQYVKDLFTNYMMMSVIASWFIAQILKGITGVFKLKKFTVVEFLFGTGGMPSSHTAAVLALATSAAMSFGLNSAAFAISALLAMIVVRDATGMRHEVGKHAKTLNMILEEHKRDDTPYEALKELVGHTPLQVFFGALLGIVVPIGMYFIPVFTVV